MFFAIEYVLEVKRIYTQKRTLFLAAIGTMIPACMLGAIAMIANNVPIIIALQNVVALLLFGLLASVLIYRNVRLDDEIIVVVSLVLLLLTFLGNGMNGVHRWIKLGMINVNAAMVVLPITIASSYNLLVSKKAKYAWIFIVCMAIILTLQPDASQLMG